MIPPRLVATRKRPKEFAGFQRYTHADGKATRGQTPVQKRLSEGSKRAATLLSRVRMARRYLAWLSVNYKVTFQNCVEHLTRVFASKGARTLQSRGPS